MAADDLGLPESLFDDPLPPAPGREEGAEGSGGRSIPITLPLMPGAEIGQGSNSNADPATMENIEKLIQQLHDTRTREQALLHLSKLKDVPGVALLLWHSPGLMFKLLKDLTDVYHLVSTRDLTQDVANRACNIITLFQSVATDQETKYPFMKAYMPMYLYPFISNKSSDRPHEYLRLASLGAIGALVKTDHPTDEVDPVIIRFLLDSQVFCHCMRCMDVGKILSKTVATFIVERILRSEVGLNYCCNFADRFYVITKILGSVADKLVEDPCGRLLKLIIRCFIELSKGPRDSDGLKFSVPMCLKHPNIINYLSTDADAMRGLQQLLNKVSNGHQAHVPENGDLFRRFI